jgi:chondroitin AC lyase
MKITIILKHTVAVVCCTYASILALQAQGNLALGKNVAVKSVESAETPGANAVDGNMTTKWSSSGSSFQQWLNVDLLNQYQVHTVVIKWIDTYFASTYDIQVSNDRVNWSTIATIANTTPRLGDTIQSLNGLCRYVQFNGRGRSGGNAGSRYRIAEFEVYGTDPVPTTPEQQVGIDTITSRLLRPYLAGPVNVTNIQNFMNAMQPNGSWSDINYDIVDANFRAGTHLNRMIAMAAAYRIPGTVFYDSAALRDKILLAFEFYYNKRPSSTNWWYNDIGGPQDYMVALLLLKGKISNEDLLKYSAYLQDQTVRFAGGAKNLSWIANITMYKGCIEDSYRLVDIAFKAIYSSLVIVPVQGDEGVKIDNSFHQHHAQLYSGGYGLSLMSDYANTIKIAEGTPFIASISATNRQVLSDVLLKGHQLLGYRNSIDFGSMGRNISREAGAYTNIDAGTLATLKAIDSAKATDYDAWIAHLSGGPVAASYRGNKHFWKSDIMTQRGVNYYLSAKVISKRTYGTESLNDENIKGYHLPLGATNILTDGGEYSSMYATWDWTRIPGTTAEAQPDSAALVNVYQIGTNDYGGGVSNGQKGAIAFEGLYRKVRTKKAYFFMNNAMLCLGAGITASQPHPILTSVNQALLSGTVTANNGAGAQTFTGETLVSNSLQWVHHRNVGYIFPAGGEITLQKKAQSGTWRSINITGDTDTVTNNVFSLWFNHSATPSNATYQYIVVPDKSLAGFQAVVNNHGFVVVRNDSSCQVVRNDVTKTYAVIFYQPGTVSLGKGLVLTADRKSMVLLDTIPNGYNIAVADPLYAQASVTLTLNKELSGEAAVYANGSTTITVSLPTGDSVGSTRKNDYLLPPPPPAEHKQGVLIYPNPARNLVTALFRPGVFTSYELMDIAGRIVKRGNIRNGEVLEFIPLSAFPAGSYFLHFKGSNSAVVKQLIKL